MATQKDRKIDFRKGNRASLRTKEAKEAIREALAKEANGVSTFVNLLNVTGLSRRGLSSNLKRLLKSGEIKRCIDGKDRRKKPYSLTDHGWRMYRQQEVSEILKRVELMALGDIMDIVIKTISSALMATVKVTEVEKSCEKTALPQLTRFERVLFESCFTGHVYALNANNEVTPYFESLKELVAIVKLMVAKKEINVELLRGLSDIIFESRLSINKLIELYDGIKKGQLVEISENY
ncbi:MAG: hypothetical protein ACUVTB_05125 [Candidatus Bathycorpusculaceae bacterium]